MNLLKILSITGLFFFCNLTAQVNFKESKIREVTINYPDSIIVTNVLINKKNIKVDNQLTYCWYRSNRLNFNKGDYYGSLVNGPYLVFNYDKKMISKGSFKYGLKEGEWKKWDENGNLVYVNLWNNGMLDGQSILYDKTGKIKKISDFRNGYLHGKEIVYNSSDTIVTYYKNGIVYNPRKLRWKNPFKKTKSTDKIKNRSKKEKKQDNRSSIKEEKKPFKLKKLFQRKKENEKDSTTKSVNN